MIHLTPILVLAVIFGALVTIIYLNIRKKERMAMIEKGVDASIFITRQKRNAQSLKYGIMLIGIALGILLGKLLASTEAFRFEEEAAYFSMIFLFGGLGLVIYHFMSKKLLAEDDPNDKPQI